MLNEAVVLLSSTFSQRLEPVGVVSNTKFHRPFLHTFRYCISHLPVERSTIVNDVAHLSVNRRRKILEHLLFVEHIFAEIITWTFLRQNCFDRSVLERFVNHLDLLT